MREREVEVRRYRSGVCGRLTRVMAASLGARENERKEGKREKDGDRREKPRNKGEEVRRNSGERR